MSSEAISNPHDKFFKESFGRKDVVQSFIREYLPEAVRTQMSIHTLTILKDSYIDKELSEHFSDLLYRVRIKGRLSYLYLLFEHKSYAAPMIGFQLLRNMVKIWEGHLKQNRRAKRLPIIIPIVISHAPEPWTTPAYFSALFEALPETNCYIPDFKAEVFDISHIPPEQIRGEIVLRVHLLILKYIFHPELIGKLEEIFQLLSRLSDKTQATEYLEVILRYLSASLQKEHEPAVRHEVLKVLKGGDTIMATIAEKWLQEGIEKGIEKEKIETTERMIEKGMTNADIRDITGLSIKKIEELRKKHNKK